MVQLFHPYMTSLEGPWQIDGETMERVTSFILGGSKITMDMTVAMKLKDDYSLEENI